MMAARPDWTVPETVPATKHERPKHANSIDIERLGIRAVGLVWLLGAVAFVALGLAATLRIQGWREAAYVALGLALGLYVLGWPPSK